MARAEGMGLELVLLLVDRARLGALLERTWEDMDASMESASLRHERPDVDERLVRPFDIDAEAEWLDWSEAQTNVNRSLPLHEALPTCDDGEEGLLHLMRWASPGAWEVWEGRAFLYFDVLLGRDVAHVDDLYAESTWSAIMTKGGQRTETELVEAVVLDWMQRREALGETLDEHRDPRILPTHEAHVRATGSLWHALARLASEEGLVGIVGREHLTATAWGHGPWNLTALLHEGLPASG